MLTVPNKQIKVSKAYQNTLFYTDQRQLQNKLPWLYTKTTHHGYDDRVINTCESGFTLHIIDDDYNKREKKKA